MDIRGGPITVGRIVQLTNEPDFQSKVVLKSVNDSLFKENRELKQLLKWALEEIRDRTDIFHTDNVPGHCCDYDEPEKGKCKFHDNWRRSLGLVNHWSAQ